MKQIRGDRLQHARANSALDVSAALAFEDKTPDTVGTQKMAKEKAGRSGADYDYGGLRCLHGRVSKAARIHPVKP
jgi:hypothetical protein